MSEVIKVGMADLNVCKAPDVITTLGLGSCIGLVFYDPVSKVGGMVHYMLPDSTKVRNNSNIAKFADTGIDELLRRVIAAGANKGRLIAKIAGGARMFEVSGLSDVGNIGARNAEAAKAKIKAAWKSGLLQKIRDLIMVAQLNFIVIPGNFISSR